MNWLKQKKLLKSLFNGAHTFYKAGKKWHFETEIDDPNAIKLVKEYIKSSLNNK